MYHTGNMYTVVVYSELSDFAWEKKINIFKKYAPLGVNKPKRGGKLAWIMDTTLSVFRLKYNNTMSQSA